MPSREQRADRRLDLDAAAGLVATTTGTSERATAPLIQNQETPMVLDQGFDLRDSRTSAHVDANIDVRAKTGRRAPLPRG
jgi:hypothetical protein